VAQTVGEAQAPRSIVTVGWSRDVSSIKLAYTVMVAAAPTIYESCTTWTHRKRIVVAVVTKVKKASAGTDRRQQTIDQAGWRWLSRWIWEIDL
jgi:hypothetical protein